MSLDFGRWGIIRESVSKFVGMFQYSSQYPISLEYSNIPEIFQYSKFQYWERSELRKGKHEIEASPNWETNYPVSVGLAHERVPFCFREGFGIEVAVV